MTTPKPPIKGYGSRTTLTPPREYHIGPTRGPFARNLGKTEIKVLAEITRGSEDDRVR